jgi:hypothetical protein
MTELTAEEIQFIEAFRQKEEIRKARSKAYCQSEKGKAARSEYAKRWRVEHPDEAKARNKRGNDKKKAERQRYLELVAKMAKESEDEMELAAL